MLGEYPFGANIPVSDLARARRFYEEILGVRLIRLSDTEALYGSGNTRFAIYPTGTAGQCGHTLGSFVVPDIEAVAASVRARGVRFEDYDLPGFKTIDGIASLGPDRVAWFKDPDGNILSLTEEGA